MYSRFKWDVHPHADPANIISGGNYRFTVLSPALVRLEYSTNGSFEDRASQVAFYRDFPKCDFSVREENGVVTVETEKLLLTYSTAESFEDGLLIKLKDEPGSSWRFGEDFETLGGTAETLDEVDGRCYMGNGVCSRNGFAVLDDTYSLLLEDDGWIGVRKEGTIDAYFFGFGYDYIGAVQALYKLTGAPPLLPAYALGNWWSRYHAYTDREYLELMDRFSKEDIPFSVGVVDMDWHITKIPEDMKDPNPRLASGWTGYSWNKALFPDYKEFLKQLHSRNLKTALNLHPAAGTGCHEDMYEEMAVANGIDPATKQRVPLDLLSQKHMATYFDVLHHPYENAGVDFWWMDWQQGTDYWWIHKPNAPGEYADPRERMHPLWLLNHLHILDIQRSGKRPMFFSRYAGPGSHRYPVGFSGDTTISWDSLNFQPEFTATASNIGYSWWSHDIGGHMFGVHDHELYIRWLQLGVFSPINRLHSSSNQYLVKEPWNYPDHIAEMARSLLRMRHALFPYIYTMNQRNHEHLLPLVQPMYYTHPKCHEAYKVPNQFWFGSELMVAPITLPNDRDSQLGMADVWFPKGNWYDFFNGMRYDGLCGRRMEVYRSLDRMPVFAKSGAIVPMAQYKAGSNQLENSEHMQLLVFPGADNRFTLYEDGGEGYAYQDGAFVKTNIALRWGHSPVLEIGMAEGDLSLIPKRRKWKIGFRGFHKDITVADHTATYDADTNTTWVEVESDVTEPVCLRICGDALIHDNSDWKERCDNIIRKSQLVPDEKTRLWNGLYVDRARGAKAMRSCVLRLRKNGSAVGKALAEMVTLTEDAFIGK